MDSIVTGRHGIRYKLIGANDFISRVIRERGEYEPELQEISAHLLAGKQGCVVDAGANMGTFSLPLATRFPQLRFLAFEVQARVCGQLRENVALNGLTNVEAHHLGLADREETVEAAGVDHDVERNIGGFSLDEDVRREGYDIDSLGDLETFTLTPLDRFGLRDLQLLKIDVEGMELKVIAGAARTLADSGYPPILFEAWTWKSWYARRRQALLDHLQELGYRITPIGQNNVAQHMSRRDTVEFSYRSLDG